MSQVTVSVPLGNPALAAAAIELLRLAGEAEVFAGTVELVTGGPQPAREVFGTLVESPEEPAAPVAPVAPAAPAKPAAPTVPEVVYEDVLEMIATDFPYAAYIESGWTDESLIAAGHAKLVKRVVSGAGVAAPETAPAAPKPSAPPQNASQATPQSTTGQAATASAGATSNWPHDPRIHTASKSVCKDGTWRLMPRLDPAIKAQVEAELEQKYGKQVGNAQAKTQAAVTTAATVVTEFDRIVSDVNALIGEGTYTGEDIRDIVAAVGVSNGSPVTPLTLQHLKQYEQFIPFVRAELGL